MATNPFSSPLATHIGGALVSEIAKLVQLTPVTMVYDTEKLYSTNKPNGVNEPTISNYATPRVNKLINQIIAQSTPITMVDDTYTSF